LIDVLRRQFEACRTWKWPGERLDRLYCNIDELGGSDEILDETTARRVLGRANRPPVKTHAWPGYQDTFLDVHHDELDSKWVDWLREQGIVFYVYRDGRDVLCSYQLFRQKYDPDAFGAIGSFLRQSDDGESRVRRWAQHVRAWRDEPDAHAIRFEHLLNQPESVIQTLGKRLGLEPEWREPLLPTPFRSIWESRWARLVRMRPESTAIINGERQDWHECFAVEDRAFFQREAGDLLIELGYESSDAWVQESGVSALT
jgi:hypothetical protein